jgi:uncharacterized protein (TIGR02145 family)
MKTIFLSFLSLMGFGFSASAQSHINIEPLSATYTAAATVQFRVSWGAVPGEGCHNARIWLWIDFIKVENNQPSGTWMRAAVADPSPGTVAPETDKGFWLQGNAGSYSQTVTVTLTNMPANSACNWCAYASDCPPNMVLDEQVYYFKGTPPFTLKAPGGTIQTVSGTTLAASALDITPVSIRDKTECPGIFCPYSGSDLYIDATHLCRQRTCGAQNWEAWIKDMRDNELYRIVKMPDGLWWTAEEMRYDATATKQSYKCKENQQRMIYNRPIVACPAMWTVPSEAQFMGLKAFADDNALFADDTFDYYGRGRDTYGFAVIPDPSRSDGDNSVYPTSCPPVNGYTYSMIWACEDLRCHGPGNYQPWYAGTWYSWNQVRCLRQL